MQFSLLSLIRLTAVAAFLFATARLCARYFPDAQVFFAILSIPLGLFGAVLLVQAAFLGFSMWAKPSQDVHRDENARNCMRMTGGGIVATMPMLYFAIVFVRNFPN